MVCKHCGKTIEPSNSIIFTAKYRHTKDQMFTCFDKNDVPMKTNDGIWVLIATPKD